MWPYSVEPLGAALEWHNTTLPAGAPVVGAARRAFRRGGGQPKIDEREKE